MKYAADFSVRFGDVDHARVVYYPRFFHFFHQTFEQWFGESLGIPYWQVIIQMNIGFPTVRVETQFKSPLRFGNDIRVELELIEIGTKSITIRYTVTRLADEVVAAVADIKTAMVDNDTFKAIAIPGDLRKRLERFRGGSNSA